MSIRTWPLGRLLCLSSCLVCLASIGTPGCAGRFVDESAATRDVASQRLRLRTYDELERVEAGLPGVLELRPDHRIGGYDALLIPRPSLGYKRGSLRLTRAGERAFLDLLQNSLVGATTAAAVPLAEGPGECVMEVRFEVMRMNLDTDRDADQLAELLLVMEFRDSTSREPLLRYAKLDRVPSPSEGVSHDTQIRRGLDRVVAEMNLATALRPAGLADDALIPGCQGTLAARGRAASEGR